MQLARGDFQHCMPIWPMHDHPLCPSAAYCGPYTLSLPFCRLLCCLPACRLADPQAAAAQWRACPSVQREGLSVAVFPGELRASGCWLGASGTRGVLCFLPLPVAGGGGGVTVLQLRADTHGLAHRPTLALAPSPASRSWGVPGG